jgi:hypothetical protein
VCVCVCERGRTSLCTDMPAASAPGAAAATRASTSAIRAVGVCIGLCRPGVVVACAAGPPLPSAMPVQDEFVPAQFDVPMRAPRVRTHAHLDTHTHTVTSMAKGAALQVPLRAVLLAALLLVAGLALLVVGTLLLTNAIPAGPGEVCVCTCACEPHPLLLLTCVRATQGGGRAWPLLVLGALLLIPGAYHVRLAYRGCTGQRAHVYAELDGDPDELDI